MGSSSHTATEAEPTTGRRTLILGKEPRAGLVKTRLVPPLTDEQAAGLAQAMLRDVVERCGRNRGFETTLCFAPENAAEWFARTFPGVTLAAQEGPGLAERLAAAFEIAWAADSDQTLVLIGSDQPLVGCDLLLQAHRALEDGADVVLGPDTGGGYYLVGLGRPEPELFTSIQMSTSSMYAATLHLACERGLRVEELALGYDIDVASDLERLRVDLRAWIERGGEEHPDFPRHTRGFLERLPAEDVQRA